MIFPFKIRASSCILFYNFSQFWYKVLCCIDLDAHKYLLNTYYDWKVIINLSTETSLKFRVCNFGNNFYLQRQILVHQILAKTPAHAKKWMEWQPVNVLPSSKETSVKVSKERPQLWKNKTGDDIFVGNYLLFLFKQACKASSGKKWLHELITG